MESFETAEQEFVREVPRERTKRRRGKKKTYTEKDNMLHLSFNVNQEVYDYFKNYANTTRHSMAALICMALEKIRSRDMMKGTEPYIPAAIKRARDVLTRWESTGTYIPRKQVRKR